MDNLVENIPIIGQAQKFARLAKTVHNCTDPVEASVDCLPPNIKYPLKCFTLAAQVVIAVNGGAAVGTALAIAYCFRFSNIRRKSIIGFPQIKNMSSNLWRAVCSESCTYGSGTGFCIPSVRMRKPSFIQHGQMIFYMYSQLLC